jgi:hypothetical protein
MVIYERLEKIRDTYIANANACRAAGLEASYEIFMTDADILTDYMDNMPIGIAEIYAGENE